jgi:hypothetical protein
MEATMHPRMRPREAAVAVVDIADVEVMVTLVIVDFRQSNY